MHSQIPPKLRWACRRGMLELDVLLGNFLENAYLTLSEPEKKIFVQLLDESDQDLFEWLLRQKKPDNIDFVNMIEKIQNYAKSSS